MLADYDPRDRAACAALWQKFRELPVLTRNLLTSAELPQAIDALAQEFSLNESSVMFVAVMVRKMLFREWDDATCVSELAAWCQDVDAANAGKAADIVTAVKNHILTIVPKEEAAEAASAEHQRVRVALLEALSKFPQLGQQTVTETRVKLKASAEPARGSLLNWIKCYREELGVGYHDSVIRGQFLFRSQNGARLSDEERERISLLLRSIEDGEMLDVDTDRQEIMFPEVVSAPKAQIGLSGAPSRMPQFDPVQDALSAAHTAAAAEKKTMPFERDAFVIAPHDRTIGEQNIVRRVNPEEFTAPSATGPMRVVKPIPAAVPQAPQAPQAGTLSFSSKHVLPAEKDLLVQSDVEPEAAMPAAPIQPPQAPKRNPSHIPNPFRIDPVSNDRLDKE